MPRALVYFAKAPRPGLVKTRLCPPLTPEQAAAAYRAMLAEVLATPAPAAEQFLYGWPADGLAELAQLVPTGVRVRLQQGTGLGERMATCFAELCAAGLGPVVLRGTDSPGLPGVRVAEAFALLESGGADAVLGPDTGGGYYLVGLQRPCPALFDGVAMGGSSVFATTCSRALAAGLRLATLAPADDIDEFADLQRHLQAAPHGQLAAWAAAAGIR